MRSALTNKQLYLHQKYLITDNPKDSNHYQYFQLISLSFSSICLIFSSCFGTSFSRISWLYCAPYYTTYPWPKKIGHGFGVLTYPNPFPPGKVRQGHMQWGTRHSLGSLGATDWLMPTSLLKIQEEIASPIAPCTFPSENTTSQNIPKKYI